MQVFKGAWAFGKQQELLDVSRERKKAWKHQRTAGPKDSW